MHPDEVRVPTLIQGVTGKLGSHILRHALLNPKLLVSVIMRDPSKDKEIVAKVEDAGGKVIKADLADKESLKDVTKGMHTVICTINFGDEKACVDGQIALIDDCVKTGVKRYVPSDFGMNYTEFTREELLASNMIAYKVKVEDYLKKVDLPSIRFYQGCITEMLMYILSQDHKYWGDEELKHDVTSYDDIARFVVAAVAKPTLIGRITFSGGKYTVKEIETIYNQVRGTDIKLTRAGSLDDLRNLVEAKKKEGDEKTVAFLALLLLMYDSRSKFPSTDNLEFKDVKAKGLEEFLKEHPDVKM